MDVPAELSRALDDERAGRTIDLTAVRIGERLQEGGAQRPQMIEVAVKRRRGGRRWCRGYGRRSARRGHRADEEEYRQRAEAPAACGGGLAAGAKDLGCDHGCTRQNSLLRRRRREHVARPVCLQRAHETRELHRFEQPRGAVVADLEPPLHVGNGGLALGGDDTDRLVVERVGLRILASAAALAFLAGETRDRL